MCLVHPVDMQYTLDTDNMSMARPPESKEDSLLGNRFILIEMVGRGSFSTVFKAVDTYFHTNVCIKIIEKSILQRDDEISSPNEFSQNENHDSKKCKPPKESEQEGFEANCALQEAAVMSKLNHPNIAKFFGMEEDEHRYYLFIEHCEGQTLLELINNANDRLPNAIALHLFRQILGAVAHLHECGYCHRDIKPENIIVDSQHNVKIIDFGLSAPLKKKGISENEQTVSSENSQLLQESPPLPNRNEIKSTDEAIDPTIRRKSQINSNFIFNTNLNSSQSDKDAQKSDFETYECNLTDFCGSLFYVAPEIVKDIPYNGALVDNWSLGIVLYIMVFGRLPYESQTASEIIEAIKTYHYEMDGMAMVCWPCQDLLSKVLEPDMKKRLSTGDMLKHPWVCPGNTGTVATTHQCLSRTSMKLPSIGNIKTNGVDIQPLNTRTLGDSAMTLAVNKGLLSKRLGKKLVKGPSNPKNKIVIPDVRNHI